MNDLGFSYTGWCACATRAEKWVHASGLYVKRWANLNWKLYDKAGRLLRYGNAQSNMEAEIYEYMTANGL